MTGQIPEALLKPRDTIEHRHYRGTPYGIERRVNRLGNVDYIGRVRGTRHHAALAVHARDHGEVVALVHAHIGFFRDVWGEAT